MAETQASILAARKYEDFRERLSGFDCMLCSLSGGRTHLVVDRGNPKARLLLVGEAPGVEEDKSGRPFVGRSGRLLDSMLLEAGIDPEKDVLITNGVKCRPPGNRVPRKAEADACFPFLARQIELQRPKVVALLGATAARALCSRAVKGFSEHVGRFFNDPACPGVDLILLFHPAYVLRNPGLRGEMVRCLRRLRRRVSEAKGHGAP